MDRKHLILLVEDNPDDAELTIRALRRSKIAKEVVAVGDGEEALEYLLGAGRASKAGMVTTPDMVLLDLKLPKIDGLQVLRTLRADERTKWLPVVILTSSNENQDVLDSYYSGANSFIRKSVDFEKFSEIADLVSHYWLGLNEVPWTSTGKGS